MILKKNTNRMDALKKWISSGLHHAKPTPYVLSKTFVQIILAVKWLMQHSSTTATTFAFSSVFILLIPSCHYVLRKVPSWLTWDIQPSQVVHCVHCTLYSILFMQLGSHASLSFLCKAFCNYWQTVWDRWEGGGPCGGPHKRGTGGGGEWWRRYGEGGGGSV